MGKPLSNSAANNVMGLEGVHRVLVDMGWGDDDDDDDPLFLFFI